MTAKTEIIRVLALADKPMATHEIADAINEKVHFYSENCLATRISELSAEGAITGKTRKDKAYKEWALVFKLELA